MVPPHVNHIREAQKNFVDFDRPLAGPRSPNKSTRTKKSVSTAVMFQKGTDRVYKARLRDGQKPTWTTSMPPNNLRSTVPNLIGFPLLAGREPHSLSSAFNDKTTAYRTAVNAGSTDALAPVQEALTHRLANGPPTFDGALTPFTVATSLADIKSVVQDLTVPLDKDTYSIRYKGKDGQPEHRQAMLGDSLSSFEIKVQQKRTQLLALWRDWEKVQAGILSVGAQLLGVEHEQLLASLAKQVSVVARDGRVRQQQQQHVLDRDFEAELAALAEQIEEAMGASRQDVDGAVADETKKSEFVSRGVVELLQSVL